MIDIRDIVLGPGEKMPQPDQQIEQEILRQISGAKSVAPRDIAVALAQDGEDWRGYLKPIKSIAAVLSTAGKLVFVRKRKIVSPEGLKGVYRLATPDVQGGQDDE